jgi:hypothetical protein
MEKAKESWWTVEDLGNCAEARRVPFRMLGEREIGSSWIVQGCADQQLQDVRPRSKMLVGKLLLLDDETI